MKPEGALQASVPCDLSEVGFEDAIYTLGIPVPHYTLHVCRANANYATDLAKRLTSLVAVVNVQLHSESEGMHRYEWWLECDGKVFWSKGA